MPHRERLCPLCTQFHRAHTRAIRKAATYTCMGARSEFRLPHTYGTLKHERNTAPANPFHVREARGRRSSALCSCVARFGARQRTMRNTYTKLHGGNAPPRVSVCRRWRSARAKGPTRVLHHMLLMRTATCRQKWCNARPAQARRHATQVRVSHQVTATSAHILQSTRVHAPCYEGTRITRWIESKREKLAHVVRMLGGA